MAVSENENKFTISIRLLIQCHMTKHQPLGQINL